MALPVPGEVLPRSWYEADSVSLAPLLLNKVLVVGACAGRIVEVEAYRSDDPASHSFRGPTARNAVMFGPPGHLYVYFTYGMHHCANVVCAADGDAQAVLIRALAPLAGLDEMRARRPLVRREIDLANGPGKLCQALGLDRSHDGTDLVGRRSPIRVLDDGVAPPLRPGVSTRVGIRVAVERPWRWFVPGDAHVSRGRPSV